jgi:hypothetical protein
MRTLYYPAQQGRQAEICRTLAARILSILRDPETAEQYKLGFTTAELRADGVTIPAGAMNALEVRGWITKSPNRAGKKAKGSVWALTQEAVRFLDDHGLATPAGGAAA